MLLLCFNRWVELQSSPSSSESTASPTRALAPTHLPRQDQLHEYAGPAPPSLPPAERLKEQTQSSPSGRLHTAFQPRQFFEPALPQGSASEKYLLVDDNIVNIKILTAYMLRLRYSCATASDGKEAYEKYTQTAGHFQWVFMDISMPVMDGIESSRLIRAFEREQQLPPAVIIALTGLASATVQQDAFASGINLFLTKPVRLEELTSIVKRQHTMPQKDEDRE